MRVGPPFPVSHGAHVHPWRAHGQARMAKQVEVGSMLVYQRVT